MDKSFEKCIRFVLSNTLVFIGFAFLFMAGFCGYNWAAVMYSESPWAINYPALIPPYLSIPGTPVSVALAIYCFVMAAEIHN